MLDIAARRADLSPDSKAVWADGRWHTYRQMNERAEALAGALAASGVQRGDRVGIIAHNHIAHFDLMLATAKLGFIHTPLNYRLSAPEQEQIGRLVEPRLLLHDEAHASLARSAATPSTSLKPLEEYSDWLDAAPAAPDVREPDALDTQMILFTGGTTGTPKGAELPYRQAFYNATGTIVSWGITSRDCAIQATPCFHAAVNALSMPLYYAGGRIVLQSTFDPAGYLQLVTDHGASILFLVPTMFGMLARDPGFLDADMSSVQWAISGGAPCPDSTRGAFAARGVRFRQGYGLTEAGVNCFSIPPEVAEAKPQSVGKPILHGRAALRDPDNGGPVQTGATGELMLSGPHVFTGYFRQPEATADVLDGGWLRTGDLARQDEDGDWYLVGRRKEMYVSGGENVYPAEVENHIASHPGVAECAVTAISDTQWGEVGLAVIVPATPPDDYDALAADIRAFLAGRLARYKLPKQIAFADSLPRSGAGKILKDELARLAREKS